MDKTATVAKQHVRNHSAGDITQSHLINPPIQVETQGLSSSLVELKFFFFFVPTLIIIRPDEWGMRGLRVWNRAFASGARACRRTAICAENRLQ